MKNYKQWTKEKSKINNSLPRPTGFHEREIWWCSIGENIGVEIDGKGFKYLRPVLIIKVFGDRSFCGLPLTSKHKKERPYFYKWVFNGRENRIIFSQIRVWDASRLIRKIGIMPKDVFMDVLDRVNEYYFAQKIQDLSGPDSPKT